MYKLFYQIDIKQKPNQWISIQGYTKKKIALTLSKNCNYQILKNISIIVLVESSLSKWAKTCSI